MSEEEKGILIKKVQEDSDQLALEKLVLSYKNMIFKIAHEYTKIAKIELEDLVQEGNLALIEAIYCYAPKGSCNSFFYSYIKNKIINLGYRESFIKYYDKDIFDKLPDKQNLSDNLKPFLLDHINKVLNQKEALVIKWRFGLNEDNWLTIKEISNITSMSERIIYEMLEHSLKKLKKSIRKKTIEKY